MSYILFELYPRDGHVAPAVFADDTDIAPDSQDAETIAVTAAGVRLFHLKYVPDLEFQYLWHEFYLRGKFMMISLYHRFPVLYRVSAIFAKKIFTWRRIMNIFRGKVNPDTYFFHGSATSIDKLTYM